MHHRPSTGPWSGSFSRRRALKGAGALALAGAAGGMAGCGGDSGESAGTTITAWHEHPEYRDAIQGLLDTFHDSHRAITVDMSYKPADQYDQLAKSALVGGAAPDAIGFIGAANLRAGLSYAAPVGGKVDVSGLTPFAKAAVVNDGKVWGCPLAAWSGGLFYHRPIFAKYGIEPPRTWDQLIAAAKTLQRNGVTPIAMPGQDMIIPIVFYTLAVSSILGKDTVSDLASGKRKLTDPDLVRAAQLLIDLKPYYNKGYAAVAYAEGKALFARGRAAMIMGGTEDYAGYVKVNPKVDLGVMGFPSPDGSRQVTVSGTDMIYTINKKSRHKPQVGEFIGWLSTAEAQQITANKLGEPVRAGIRSTAGGQASRVVNGLLEAGNPATLNWFENDALLGAFAAGQKSGGILTGALDAAGFAVAMQKGIATS